MSTKKKKTGGKKGKASGSKEGQQISTPKPSTGRKLTALKAPMVTDWSGVELAKKARFLVQPGCIVRACVGGQDRALEALYFQITKVKDGTAWGIVQDTYRLDGDLIGLPVGKTFPFRLDDISEIPIDWQPKALKRQLQRYLNPRNMGRCPTGIF